MLRGPWPRRYVLSHEACVHVGVPELYLPAVSHYDREGSGCPGRRAACVYVRRRPEQKLPDFLDEYKSYAGLSVHWIIVGPSGHETRAEAGGVLRHYTHCNSAGSPWIKTIANTFYLTNIAYHPHNFEFRCGPGPACMHTCASAVSGAWPSRHELERVTWCTVLTSHVSHRRACAD